MVTAMKVRVRLGPAAAEQHDTVLYKGMECGMEISAKYLEGNDGFALLVIPHSLVDGGCGSDGDGDSDTLDSGDVPEIRLGWGGGWGLGGPVGVANNNVAWLCAKPEAGSGAVAAGERWRCCSLVREIRCESVLLSRPQRLFVSSGGNDKFACEKLPRSTVLYCSVWCSVV